MVEVGKIGDKTLVLDGRYISIFRGGTLMNKWAYMGYLLPDGNAYIYRRKVHIKELSGKTLTDYQIKIVLGAGDPIFAHARSAGEDIRFCYHPEAEMIPHWIEKYDPDAEEAIIWVKVPEIPANSEIEIYMYYGNPEVASESDGEATFEFFDDFEEMSLDTEKWGERGSGSYVISNSIIEMDAVAEEDYHITSVPIFKRNKAIRAKFKFGYQSASSFVYKAIGFTQADNLQYGSNHVSILSDVRDTELKHNIMIDGTRYRYDLSPAIDAFDIWYVGEVIWAETFTKAIADSSESESSYTPSPDLYADIWVQGNADKVYVDWILVRKYTEPEPSVSVGAEE